MRGGGWDTWPAVDRHTDRRAEAQLAHLAEGLNARSALLVSKMDWQLENVLLYSARNDRRDLAWARLDDVLLHFPFLVRDNLAESRDLALTADAAGVSLRRMRQCVSAGARSGPGPRPRRRRLPHPSGTPYVLTLLPPPGGRSIDQEDFAKGLAELAGNRPARGPRPRMRCGPGARRAPTLYRSAPHPFREDVLIGGEPSQFAWIPGSRRTPSAAAALPMFCMEGGMSSLRNAESAWSGFNAMARRRHITEPVSTPRRRVTGSGAGCPPRAESVDWGPCVTCFIGLLSRWDHHAAGLADAIT